MPGVGLRRTVSYLRHGFASFASTGSGIRITHADGRAARQRERTRTPNATAAGICAASSSARSPAYAVALAAADSAPDLRVRIRAELKSMTFSVTKLRADDAAACSTSSQYLTKRSSFASTAGGIRITHGPSEVENAHR